MYTSPFASCIETANKASGCAGDEKLDALLLWVNACHTSQILVEHCLHRFLSVKVWLVNEHQEMS